MRGEYKERICSYSHCLAAPPSAVEYRHSDCRACLPSSFEVPKALEDLISLGFDPPTSG